MLWPVKCIELIVDVRDVNVLSQIDSPSVNDTINARKSLPIARVAEIVADTDVNWVVLQPDAEPAELSMEATQPLRVDLATMCHLLLMLLSLHRLLHLSLLTLLRLHRLRLRLLRLSRLRFHSHLPFPPFQQTRLLFRFHIQKANLQ